MIAEVLPRSSCSFALRHFYRNARLFLAGLLNFVIRDSDKRILLRSIEYFSDILNIISLRRVEEIIAKISEMDRCPKLIFLAILSKRTPQSEFMTFGTSAKQQMKSDQD